MKCRKTIHSHDGHNEHMRVVDMLITEALKRISTSRVENDPNAVGAGIGNSPSNATSSSLVSARGQSRTESSHKLQVRSGGSCG
jgi:hypothetical protein